MVSRRNNRLIIRTRYRDHNVLGGRPAIIIGDG